MNGRFSKLFRVLSFEILERREDEKKNDNV